MKDNLKSQLERDLNLGEGRFSYTDPLTGERINIIYPVENPFINFDLPMLPVIDRYNTNQIYVNYEIRQ